jgi:glycosyltransferase 2 family protein
VVAVGTLVLAGVEGRLTGWRPPEALVPAVAVGVGAWALVFLGQQLARRHGARTAPAGGDEPHREVATTLREALTRRPAPDSWNWWPQLGSASLGVVLEASALAAALHAVGGNVPLLATATVYAALHLLWSVLPVTGMPGAADVALLLALTSVGAPLAGACGGVLAFRLLTFWAPAGLGSLLSVRLEQRHLT